MTATYTCPVCYFNQMDEPPEDRNICDSCGTEFNYDDADTSHEELRARWVENGKRWWNTLMPKPEGDIYDEEAK